MPRGIRRRYVRGRISVRLRQFGRGDGLGARNCRTRQRVVLFEMSFLTYGRLREQLLLRHRGSGATREYVLDSVGLRE